MDIFQKASLIGCFRELNVRKFRKFFPDHFYDKKVDFYDKKTDFRPETRESRVRRRFRESRVRRRARESKWGIANLAAT